MTHHELSEEQRIELMDWLDGAAITPLMNNLPGIGTDPLARRMFCLGMVMMLEPDIRETVEQGRDLIIGLVPA